MTDEELEGFILQSNIDCYPVSKIKKLIRVMEMILDELGIEQSKKNNATIVCLYSLLILLVELEDIDE
jgi:hypothetical protein